MKNLAKLSGAVGAVVESLEGRRLFSSMQLDLTFGHGGVATGPTEFTYSINDLAVQADGKVLAVGYGQKSDSLDFTIERFNADGSTDTAFGRNGLVFTDFHGGSDVPVSVIALAGGKFLVAGHVDRTDVEATEFAVARYNADGSLDATFGVNGEFVHQFGDTGNVHQMVMQADGKILLAGREEDSTNGVTPILVRLNANGTLDQAFGDNGVAATAPHATVSDTLSVAVQQDGKIVVYNDMGGNGFSLARLNSDGSVDTTYGTQGRMTVGQQLDSTGVKLLMQPDGMVVVVGSVFSDDSNPKGAFFLARVDSGGVLDSNFGTGGIVKRSFGQTVSWSLNGALQADGKIIQVGMVDYHFATARFNPDGSLDISFGFHGLQTVNLQDGKYLSIGGPEEDFAFAAAIRPDGSILVGGGPEDQSRFGLIQFSPDPAITISSDGALYVRGSDSADYIDVARSADAAEQLNVTINGHVYHVYAPLGVLVRVDANGGDDVVVVENGVGSCSISGGDGNDSLVGGDGNDSISGNAGKDRIDGRGGDDRVAGNGGNDAITGGEGRDRVYGDDGNDAEIGGSGADRMWGGNGNDLVSGNSGSDIIYGDAGINTLAGGAGADRIYDFAKTDTLIYGGDPTIRLVDQETGLISLIEGLV